MSDLSSNEMNEVLKLDYYQFNINEREILAVYVPECKNKSKPYYFKKLSLSNVVFMR